MAGGRTFRQTGARSFPFFGKDRNVCATLPLRLPFSLSRAPTRPILPIPIIPFLIELRLRRDIHLLKFATIEVEGAPTGAPFALSKFGFGVPLTRSRLTILSELSSSNPKIWRDFPAIPMKTKDRLRRGWGYFSTGSRAFLRFHLNPLFSHA
jgi:hypothetical protein